MATKGLLSISEFSKLTGVPRSKLIYYDEIGLFPAAERGENNYRYYALNQIIIAGFINDLVSFGVPLKQLLELKDIRTPELMLDVVEDSIKAHQEKIANLRETLSVMKVMSGLMKQGIEARDKDIEVAELEPQHYLLGNENIHQDAATFYPAWLTFMNSAHNAGVNINYPVGGYFDDMDRFGENPNMPARYFFVSPQGKQIREGGKWLTAYCRGFYGQADDLPGNMQAYAKEHGLTITGPVFNTFLLDELSTPDPDQYLMRAIIKVVDN